MNSDSGVGDESNGKLPASGEGSGQAPPPDDDLARYWAAYSDVVGKAMAQPLQQRRPGPKPRPKSAANPAVVVKKQQSQSVLSGVKATTQEQ